MRNIGGGRLAYPKIAEQTMGFRFPKEPATTAQLAALNRIMLDYLRIDTIKRFPDVSVELLGELMGLSERQAKTVVKEARSVQECTDLYLVIRILYGMLTRALAGTLGTPKNMDAKWLFRCVYEFDFLNYGGKWSEALVTYVVPLPPDAVVSDTQAGPIAHIKGEKGSECNRRIHIMEDGSRCIPASNNPSNSDTFRMLHAAFRVEYLEWLRESR
jgi:hypothetical protein